MRVAVLVHWNLEGGLGVRRKVIEQIRAWIRMGAEVSLHIVTRSGVDQEWKQQLEAVVCTVHEYHGMERLNAWRCAAEAIEAAKPDVIYHRYDLWMPPLVGLARRRPLILEINTNDVAEYQLLGGARAFYNRVTRRLLLRLASGMVFVTRELERASAFRIHSCARTVIANGIALKEYPVLDAVVSGDAPQLCFVGSAGQPWHGVEKIAQFAHLFPRWQFHCIGISALPGAASPPNVRTYGVLSRQQYRQILQHCTAGIGPLAPYRNNMFETCALKVREYLSYGLPVILAGQDTDFPVGAPFVLELPNTEENIKVSREAIHAFVGRWRGKRVERPAILHLDVEHKEARRLDFFQKVKTAWK